MGPKVLLGITVLLAWCMSALASSVSVFTPANRLAWTRAEQTEAALMLGWAKA